MSISRRTRGRPAVPGFPKYIVRISLFFLLVIFLGLLAGTRAGESPFFQDRSAIAGINFRLENHPTGTKYLIETMTGGCAFLDYDHDGLLDIFLVNGADIVSEPGKPPRFDKSDPKYWNRLYRNLGGGRFEDVTERAGVRGGGYGIGVAVGDYDNDGYPDLYVTNYGHNELYHNERNGTFRDVTAQAGVAGGGFSASAAFFDYDRDGLPDLFVTRYVDWSFENNPFCGAPGQRDYCHPKHFKGVPNLLFKNQGNGTFRDVSKETGIALPSGKSLGIGVADFDLDGWPDVFIANDSVPEFLLHNRGGKRFEEVGVQTGTALTGNGTPFAGMGLDFADYDNDGWPDIFVTALSLEGFVLFRNNQDFTFSDVSETTGIRQGTFYLSGWGTKMVDFENRGWKDLFVADSHVMRDIENVTRTISYLQPPLLLKNEHGRFVSASDPPGPVFRQKLAARGAAFGDFDNDGDVDILVQNLGNRPLLLENLVGNKKHWVGFELVGRKSDRDAIGARVRVTDDLGRDQYYFVTRSSSYLSSSDPRIVVGLGDQVAASAEITWPSGRILRIDKIVTGRYNKIVEPD